VSRAVGLVERAEGNVFVFDAAPRGKDTEARLEQLFTADREEEWTEFLAECAKFDQRIDKEIPRSSPLPSSTRRSRTLERLRRWFRDLRRQDVLASSQKGAEQRQKECGELLEDFAERVYA
jgi:hypothetical protein